MVEKITPPAEFTNDALQPQNKYLQVLAAAKMLKSARLNLDDERPRRRNGPTPWTEQNSA